MLEKRDEPLRLRLRAGGKEHPEPVLSKVRDPADQRLQARALVTLLDERAAFTARGEVLVIPGVQVERVADRLEPGERSIDLVAFAQDPRSGEG